MEPTQPITTSSLHHPASKKKLRLMWVAIAGVIILAVVTVVITMNMSKESSSLASNASVSIGPESISPSTIRLGVGQSITLSNTDQAPHGLTADQEALPGFETPEPLNNGDTYSYTFENKGTYHIYDPIVSQKLNATIIVE